MNQPASTTLRWLYVLAILSAALPFGMSGWVALASETPMQALPYLVSSLLPVIGLWRLYRVARYRETLDSFVYTGIQKVLRGVGIVGMAIGVLFLVLRFTYRPLVQLILTPSTGTGVEYFVVSLYISLLSGFGATGIIIFELSRLLGFERATSGRA